jgi:hypothetical protein
MSNYEDLKSQARQKIILNDLGYPSVFEEYPLVYLDELGIGSVHTPHPAFKINDKVLSKIYLPSYIATVKNGRAYSLPNQTPAVNVNFDTAKAYCEKNGAGFHLMTEAEWGLVHNMLTAADIHPRGNTSYGKSHINTYEKGVMCSDNAKTLTGTGDKSWSTDMQGGGINDFVGNVTKWCGGARLVDGEIQVIADNNAAITGTDQTADSSAWKAILEDGTLVAPGTSGTLKFSYSTTASSASSNFYISTTLDNTQTDDGAYGQIDFASMKVKSGVTIPDILKALAFYPMGTSTTGHGNFYMRTNGERLLRRGGNYGHGASAGEAYGNFYYPRSLVSAYLGFFCAYYDPQDLK